MWSKFRDVSHQRQRDHAQPDVICCKEPQCTQTQGKKMALRAKSGRGEAWASAACPHSPQGHALPSWTHSLGGRNRNFLQARSPGGEAAAEAPTRRLLSAVPGSLSSTFSPCGLPAPAVNLCLEILKECNYFPEEPKQRCLPSSGMCEDTPRRWQREIAAGLLIQTWIFPPLPAAPAEQGVRNACQG